MGVFDIQGLNCIFQVKIGDDYKTVVCAKSFTFNPITDMKETTTVGSGFWREFRPRKLSYTITFNGMLQVESLVSQEIAKTLLIRQTQFLPFDYQLIYEDNSSNVMVVRGSVYVTSSLFDASPVNLVNATHELQGTGPIEILDQLPVPVNIHIVSTGDPAIAALIQFKLFNSNGDIIFDSGQLPEASGGDLAHPVDVTGQVESGSYSFFWQVTANAIGNTFDLDAPPTKTTAFNDNTNNENSFGVQVYDFTADREVTFAFGTSTPPPTCVPPAIAGSPTLPDGQVSVPYAASFAITGSTNFNLTNITKPSWLTLTVNNTPGSSSIQLSGTPDVDGTGITVSFDINNACGTAPFSDTIDIAAAPSTINSVDYDFQAPGSGPWLFRIYRQGAEIVNSAVTTSGTFQVLAGENVQVLMASSGFPIREHYIQILNITDTITIVDETTLDDIDTDFNTGSSKVYSILGIIT